MSYWKRLRRLSPARQALWLLGPSVLVVLVVISGVVVASPDGDQPIRSAAADVISRWASAQPDSDHPEGDSAEQTELTPTPISSPHRGLSSSESPTSLDARDKPSSGKSNPAFPKGYPSIACEVMNNSEIKVVLRGQTFRMSCTVTSKFGFSAPSTLSCGEMMVGRPPRAEFWVEPGPLPCSFSPGTVTPPPDGSVRSTLTIQVPPEVELTHYDYAFRVDSPDADSHAFPNQYPLNLFVDRPYFTADCGTGTLSFVEGSSAHLVCRMSVPRGFGDGIEILLGGINPYPSGHVSISTDVTQVAPSPAGGTYQFVVTATSDLMGAGSYTIPLQMRSLSGLSHRSVPIELRIEIADYVHD